MDLNLTMVVVTFFIGIVVGLTGMGGGALMTPALVMIFNVPPTMAVSSDLVAAAVMKPVGSWVHLRRGTVNLELVRYLCLGSVPSAFVGVLVIRAVGRGKDVEHAVQVALGVALMVAAVGLIVRAYLRLLERARHRDGRAEPLPQDRPHVAVRRVPTVLLGAVAGLIVGATSVGSGSIVIIALMALYPALKASQLVGTDLLQAVPMVAAAALGHLIFGDFNLSLTASLVVGSVPGAWLGARLSANAPGGIVRRCLALVLFASSLKMLGVSTQTTGVLLLVTLLGAPLVWVVVRRRLGFTAFTTAEERALAGG